MVRDPAQAEEVAQEAFLEIWRTSGRFDPAKGSPLGLAAHHRAPQGRRPGPVRRGVDAGGTRRTTSRTSRSSTTRPPRPPHASLEARRVRGALHSLTPVQREALELAYFGGYTHTEVATMLELPVGTAKTRIRDGLIRLRDTMGVGS